jgi:hypothetical protein
MSKQSSQSYALVPISQIVAQVRVVTVGREAFSGVRK